MTVLFAKEAKAINRLKLKWESVRAALLLDLHSHDWKAKFCPDEALEFCRHSPSYNNCYSERLVQLVKDANRIVPKEHYGKGNVNNGSPAHHFLIGNEGSRVIYVVVEMFALSRLQQDVISDMVRDLHEAGQIAQADENHVQNIGIPGESLSYTTIRFWWD